MENREITERRVRASSEFGDASRGRLHSETESWVPTQNNTNQWLLVDLGNQHTKVTRVATQGRNAYGGDHWVTKYKLQYGNDTANMQNYTEQGRNTKKMKLFFLLHKNMEKAQFTEVQNYLSKIKEIYLNFYKDKNHLSLCVAVVSYL